MRLCYAPSPPHASCSVSPQAPVSSPRLHALGRMVDILHVNPLRMHQLWPIFLAHVLEVLHSPHAAVRSVALDALRRTIVGALGGEPGPRRSLDANPEPARLGSAFASPIAAAEVLAAAGEGGLQEAAGEALLPGSESDGAVGSREDLEHMLLVALDSLYRQNPELDVRRGLIKIVINVLHHHGHVLSRGWIPLLRLLEAVPTMPGQEWETLSLGFQCLQLVVSDFLPLLPKEHIPRTLDVVALFAQQDIILNVSLTAITILWNVSDQLARSSERASAAIHVAAAAGGTASDAMAAISSNLQSSNREDVSEADSLELLRIAFRALHTASNDARPELRNSGVRTLFLAICSNGSKFPSATWREVMWELSLPLLTHTHHMACTSSDEVVTAAELGKDGGGRSVMMLTHHSRNTEQKQWEETLVLVLAGLTKVLRAFLPRLAEMEGFQEAWGDVVDVLRSVLAAGKKGPSCAATTLISSLIQAHGPPAATGGRTSIEAARTESGAAEEENGQVAPPALVGGSGALQPWMWRAAMRALDDGVRAMAAPNTPVLIQVLRFFLTINLRYCLFHSISRCFFPDRHGPSS